MNHYQAIRMAHTKGFTGGFWKVYLAIYNRARRNPKDPLFGAGLAQWCPAYRG